MSKNAVIVFMRNPELGKVKTRLAKRIGALSALKIYNHLLSKTQESIRVLDCDKAVFYSEKVKSNDLWESTEYQKHLQKGEDFGEKMYQAFLRMFQGKYEKVIIIGSDLYHLKPDHIKTAFDQLDTHEIVIGPAYDGGYYLLGMKKNYPELFKNKQWGTSTVLLDTLNDLKHTSVHLLEKLNDIDTYEDMENIPELKKLIINE